MSGLSRRTIMLKMKTTGAYVRACLSRARALGIVIPVLDAHGQLAKARRKSPALKQVDPVKAEERRQRKNASRRTGRTNAKQHVVPSERAPKSDVAARLAEIPQEDRRSLTGQLFGDPMPERSALGRPLS